jgi:hypothetical protein
LHVHLDRITTGAAVTVQLGLVVHNYVLAPLAGGLFIHLIVFRVVTTPFCLGKDDLISTEITQRTDGKLENKMTTLGNRQAWMI